MSYIKKWGLLILSYIVIPIQVFAQPGANDPTFNPGDAGFGSGGGANNSVNAVAIQADGKIFIGGSFTTYNGTSVTRIARLNADGSLDPTFNSGTGASGGTVAIRTIAIQTDGKIIIGGDFFIYNGTSINRIARLNSDGSLDATFNLGSGASNSVNAISIQSDGKILIGGSFNNFSGTLINSFARLNPDGTLDGTFSLGTGTNNWVQSISIQFDGKIIIGGDFTSYNGTVRNRIARLNSDGTLDPTFNPGIGANSSVYTSNIQSDGKIIIGGNFTSYNGTAVNRIVRINADGTSDISFTVGTGANNTVWTGGIQSDGKIIIGGNFTSYNSIAVNRILRISTDGTLDPTFNVGSGTNNTVNSLSIQSNGKIIIGGNFTLYNGSIKNRITRLNTDGALDPAFNFSSGANNFIQTTAIQSDGKIIVGGDFTVYNGSSIQRIARLNTDGSLDATFTGTGANLTVQTISIQSDGKIIVGGNFTAINGTGRSMIARLNADGTVDGTFNPGTGANLRILTTAIQADGKIIIGGDFSTFNGTTINRIARLNSNGTLDATFNVGTGSTATVVTIAIQSDGKILVGSTSPTHNGIAVNNIYRLNSNGALDATFNIGTGANNAVRTIAIQTDNKVIIGGDFTTFNGSAINRIARLNSNGTIDLTFNSGIGANLAVNDIAIQSDGKIIMCGGFTNYNGTTVNHVARLNASGTLDNTFNSGTGINGPIVTSSIQSDGKIIIGGYFTSYNGTGRNRIARILVNGSALPIELIDFTGVCEISHTQLQWSSASEHINDYYTIERAGSNGEFQELVKVKGQINSTQQTDYSFADYYAEPGFNYYHLSQTDIDGIERSLKTISVENNCLTGSGLDISSWYNNESNVIQIAYIFDHRQLLEAQILNMMGEVVASAQVVLEPDSRKADIQLNEELSNGIYVLRLLNESIQFSDKFCIGK